MIGCLCLHGFTGGPYEIEPLIDYLKARTDWTFRVPILPGHGDPLSLKGIQYQQWITHAEEELKDLLRTCKKVYVIGFSMGGLIASYLAANYPIDKLILLSAAAYYINPGQMAADLKTAMKDFKKGLLIENELFSRYKRKIIETPITATLQFRKLVSFIRPVLPQVKAPTLIAQGEYDGIVPLKTADYLYRTIGAKRKKVIIVKQAKHRICYCEQRNTLFSHILRFLVRK